MSTILTPHDRHGNKQDKFNDWTRNIIEQLTFQVVALSNNLIAIQKAAGLTDEQIQAELDKMQQPKETK